jgi:hypothetical protein
MQPPDLGRITIPCATRAIKARTATETVDLTSFDMDRWFQGDSSWRCSLSFPPNTLLTSYAAGAGLLRAADGVDLLHSQFTAVAKAKARLVDRGESNCTVTTIPLAVFHIMSSTGPPAPVRTTA